MHYITFSLLFKRQNRTSNCSLFLLHHQVYAWSLSCVRLFVIPWTGARQAPLSMGILQAGILEWVAMLSSRIKFILSNHFINQQKCHISYFKNTKTKNFPQPLISLGLRPHFLGATLHQHSSKATSLPLSPNSSPHTLS